MGDSLRSELVETEALLHQRHWAVATLPSEVEDGMHSGRDEDRAREEVSTLS